MFIRLFCLLFFTSTCLFAQNANSFYSNLYNKKINEFYRQYAQDGFKVLHQGDLRMENKTEFPILMELNEGEWYQFIVVGDPAATKYEMKFGLAGLGDIITDKFSRRHTNEFWTQFSFLCPRSGKYLFTFYQLGEKNYYKGHVGVMKNKELKLRS